MKEDFGRIWEISLKKLKEGNKKFLNAKNSLGDVSPETRLARFRDGQYPYAVIITCSDSRVIPESIFSAGIGELFVIRAAGNVTDGAALGSIEYALSHLHTPLVIVLGHTACGAVNAAIKGAAAGRIKMITDKIRLAIREERDDCEACRLNVNAEVEEIIREFGESYPDTKIMGAVYRTDSGKVEFID